MAKGGFGGFGGMGGMGNMQQMLKQAQKMQADMQAAQAELEEMELVGASSGGLVTVTVNGKSKVKAIKIKPQAVDPEDVEMLEDLIIAAYNNAVEQAEKENEERMPSGLGGMF
ncbi:MAG: YbaB/EbfC family nucleoid-associated protein [Firmicutes bacterium]|nr:YbaB/EbfC family nucleoid-associated protein [Bacillota bacterium]